MLRKNHTITDELEVLRSSALKADDRSTCCGNVTLNKLHLQKSCTVERSRSRRQHAPSISVCHRSNVKVWNWKIGKSSNFVETFFVARVTGKVKSQTGNVRIRGRTNFEHGAFGVAGPRLWNALPISLRQSDLSLGQFRRALKTHLFDCVCRA